jgi:hypothetical protein
VPILVCVLDHDSLAPTGRLLKKSEQQIARGLKVARDEKIKRLIGTTEVVPCYKARQWVILGIGRSRSGLSYRPTQRLPLKRCSSPRGMKYLAPPTKKEYF